MQTKTTESKLYALSRKTGLTQKIKIMNNWFSSLKVTTHPLADSQVIWAMIFFFLRKKF